MACPVYPKPLKNRASLLFMFFRKRRSWLDGLYERSYRMKMGQIKLPGLELFMVNQPELVKQVMVDEVESFPKHRMLGDILEPLLGESIFTTNGAQWRKQRDMLDVAFDNGQVEKVFDRMQEATARMLERLEQQPEGAIVNVDPEMTLVTADIIFRTIMSSSLDMEDAQAVLEAFVRFQEASPKLALLRMFRVPDNWLLRLSDRKRRGDARTIRSSLERVIRPRHEAFARGEADEHDDILSSILCARDPDTGQPFSFEEIVDQVAMLFLAGHETSASALTWTLYLLAISPEIQQAAADEVSEILEGASGPIPLPAIKRYEPGAQGVHGVDEALSSRGIFGTTDDAANGHARQAASDRRLGGGRPLAAAPASGPVGCAGRILPDAFRAQIRGARGATARLPALWYGAACLHRRDLRNAGGRADPGRTAAPLPFRTGPRFRAGSGRSPDHSLRERHESCFEQAYSRKGAVMKERMAGFVLMTVIVPMALMGYLLIVWVGFFGRTERARAGVRAMDHFVNATLFNGHAWESVSSHAWRVREHKHWARAVIWITDKFQKDHCMRANKREQAVLDLVLKKGLHKQTIK